MFTYTVLVYNLYMYMYTCMYMFTYTVQCMIAL